MVESVSSSIEKMRLREALHEIMFAFESDINWYMKRAAAKNRNVSSMLYNLACTRVLMLSPFAPHISEEMWEKLGQKNLVTASSWPDVSGDEIDANAIQSEELLKSIIDDVANILKITKMENPRKIVIYTSSSFKNSAYHSILSHVMNGDTNMGSIMKNLIANPETVEIKQNPDFVQKTIKDILSEPMELRKIKLGISNFDEKSFIESELSGLMKANFGVELDVYSESDESIYDPKSKARFARPFKPAILVE